MTISTKEVRALFKMLTKVGSAVVNRWSQNKKNFFTIPVVTIDLKGEDADQIGFTTAQRKVYLNPYHEYITDLPTKEQQIKAIKGVWTHEIMHQLMTDFALSETLFRRPTQVESEIYHTVFNIVEDARIEFFAPSYIGGRYTTDEFDKNGKLVFMSDLSYMKQVIYKKTDPIDDPKNAAPLSQVINAMIMYGDCGIVKGKFTSKEAEDIFYKLLPLYDRAIEEPLFRKAAYMYQEIAEITRPLWENSAEFEKMARELAEKTGRSHNENSNRSLGSDSSSGASTPKKESIAGKGRAATKKIRAEEVNEMAKKGNLSTSGDGNGGEEYEIENPEDLSAEALEALSSTSSGSDPKSGTENGEGSELGSKAGDGEGSESGSKAGDGEGSETGETADSKANTKAKSDSSTRSELGHIEKNGITPPEIGTDGDEEVIITHEQILNDIDEYIIPEDEIQSIASDLDKFIREEENERRMLEDDTAPIEIPNIKSRYFGNVSVINRNVRVTAISDDIHRSKAKTSSSRIEVTGSEYEYQACVSGLKSSIIALEKQFKRIFKNRPEEKLHKSSGKVNINRMSTGRVTSRIFDKKRPAGKPSDIAIFLCIDESGSMSCSDRYKYARLAAIGLAELCANLGIPLYVMGFTADESSYDAVHLHYIKWKNTKATRMSLLAVSARSNNFDGYSIRYATKILEKRPETHKLLFVISDGLPAAQAYMRGNGTADTLQAVKEANRVCTPIGVSIGDSSCANHVKSLYGINAVVVPDVSTLFTKLGTTLRKIIKQEI